MPQRLVRSSSRTRLALGLLLVPALFSPACTKDGDGPSGTSTAGGSDSGGSTSGETRTWADLDTEQQTLGCFSLRSDDTWLAATGDSFGFTATSVDNAARFFMQPSDLGTYLLYDQDQGYLVAEEGPLTRQTTLESDLSRIEDGYVSGGEWLLETSSTMAERYHLRSRRLGGLLGPDGLTEDTSAASNLLLEANTGCAEHPELSLDATGSVTTTTFDDGDLFGIVDTHSHIMSNLGFGGGLFHGAPYHRLGVSHALADCEQYHGEMGRTDFFGYAYDSAGNDSVDLVSMIGDLAVGQLSEDNHDTSGYPDFTDWPNARKRMTHQTQYHRWLERAWLGGLRLVVNHATSNSVICNLTVGEGFQPSRYDCEDMTAVDRTIDATWDMQRYIDARSGGEGKGWFRVVQTPAEAREVIAAGKLAVVLGIETSDLFRCNLTPRPDGPECDEDYVIEQLDAYHARGVRALFPVHKYDNAFSPGDGSSDFIELGNFLNSGHWTNMTEDCPDDITSGFDSGDISFGGLQSPRDEYLSEPPNDLSNFPEEPLTTAFSFAGQILEPSISGDWCQNATLTPLGESLIQGVMARGMILEVDHLPQWSYKRTFELLEENDYPAAGTHGRNWEGRIYQLGGVSKINLGRCQDADDPGGTLDTLHEEVALIEEMGGYPAAGFGFDFNGFAGVPGPRFGDEGCSSEQSNAISYPFDAYGGDASFSQPFVGNRQIDFDTEGMVHIGLLPELIQDARTDAADDTQLEPLFRSAEAYVRMWEKAEERGAALSGR